MEAHIQGRLGARQLWIDGNCVPGAFQMNTCFWTVRNKEILTEHHCPLFVLKVNDAKRPIFHFSVVMNNTYGYEQKEDGVAVESVK